MKEVNIFLSYRQDDNDKVIADGIYDYFEKNRNIELHRDIIDINKWGSIKEYMLWYM